MKNPRSRKPNFQRRLYHWHKRIGISVALFIIWLAVSGWLLNHTDSLNLAHWKFHSPALANWYNLNFSFPTHVFVSKHHWVVSNVFDGEIFTDRFSDPVGIAETETLIAIASRDELILLDSSRALIEKIGSSELPIKNIDKMGSGCNGIVVANSNEIMASLDGIEWFACNENVEWSAQKEITSEQSAAIEKLLVPEVSVEKVILDLHTGRFFGRYGALVVDAVGLCLTLLALSGIWMFFRIGGKGK